MSSHDHIKLTHPAGGSSAVDAPDAGGMPVRLAGMLTPQSNNFGVVRIAMALAVLVSHGFYLHTGTTSAEPLVAWTGHSLGEHAVQVFFFLSGILVAQSFERSASLLDFAAARILRIFPGLLFCVVVTALVLGPAVSSLPLAAYVGDPGLMSYLLRTASLATGSAPLPGVFETAPAPGLVNMSLWTLKYEVLCYAGLAFAGCAGLFKPAWRPYAAAVLAVFVAGVFIEPAKSIQLYTPFDNIRYFAVFFASGVLAYLMRANIVVRGAVLAVLFAIFIATIGTPVGVLGAAAFLGYGTLYVACWPAGWLRALANRYDVSFGIYIYACPIQQFLIGQFPQAGAVGLIVLAIALTLPVALCSWLLVERPALRLRVSLAGALTARLAGLRYWKAQPVSGPARR
ncbi:MAG TPA: acyltransferase [Hyphomicrobium sp.]|nr:acyltransferase [Hyphomicrobium sp.]